MKNATQKQLWLAAFLILLIDQVTKIWALKYLPFEEQYVINSLFSIQRIFNDANILAVYSIHELPFSLSVNTFRVLYVIYGMILTFGIWWVCQRKELNNGDFVAECGKTALFIILGAIWGNALDRIFREEGVVDFIRVDINSRFAPIMNIADIMIYVGEIALIMGWSLIVWQLITKKKSSKLLKAEF